MKSVEQYNSLDGKTVNREEITQILNTAIDEGNTFVKKKLLALLMSYNNDSFKIHLSKVAPIVEAGLNAPRHDGLAKEALDNCGRLKKGYRYKFGKITKVEKKKKAKKEPKSKPKKTTVKNSQKKKKTNNNKASKKSKTKKTTVNTTVKNNIDDFNKKHKTNVKALIENLNKNKYYEFSADATFEDEAQFIKDLLFLNFSQKLKLRANKIITKQTINFDKDELPGKQYTVRKNKDVFKALKTFAGKDDKIPVMQGVFVEKDAYVLTDAHQLIIYKTKTNKKDIGKILNPYGKDKSTKYIDGKYPNYKAVMPNYDAFSSYFDIQNMYNHFNSFINLSKPINGENNQVFLKSDFAVNYTMFKDILKSLLMLGSQKIKFAYSKPNRALIIKTDNQHTVLLMPIIIGENLPGANLYYKILQNVEKNEPKSKPKINTVKNSQKKTKTNNNKASKKPESTKLINKAIELAEKLAEEAGLITQGFVEYWYKFDANEWKRNDKHRIYLNLNYGRTYKGQNKWSRGVTYYIDLVDDFKIVDSSRKYNNASERQSVKNIAEEVVEYLKKNDFKIGLKGAKSKTYKRAKSNYSSTRHAWQDVAKKTGLHHTQVKSQHTDKHYVWKVINKGMKAPVETEQAETIERKPQKNNKIVSASQAKTADDYQYFNVPGPTGKFLQRVERKPKESVAITIDGKQGAGKTTLLYQFLNDFASGGNMCLFATLEQHVDSVLTQDLKDKYLAPKNRSKVDMISDFDDKQEFYSIINHYDIIFIDSWQKLIKQIGKLDFDEDLRKKLDGKVFVVIFQQTTTGRTKGGADIVFDGDIIIKMETGATFAENYAYFDKNRYTIKPIEKLRYNVAGKYVYDPTENIEENNTESETVKNSNDNTTVDDVEIIEVY